MREKVKNIFSFLARFGLSALLLGYLFRKIDFTQAWETVKSADMKFIYLAFAVYLLINLLLLFRWDVFIRALALKVPLRSVVSCFFIGLFFNLFLPSSTGGDIVKTIGLFKDTSEKAKVVASVVCDRLSGFVSITLVALVAFIFGHKLVNDNSLLMFIAALASFSAGLVLVLFHEGIYSFFCQAFDKFPKIKAKLMNLHYTMALLKGQQKAILLAIGMSCLSQVTLSIVFSLIAKGLRQDIPFIYFLIFVPLICVVSSLPSVGGLGVRDVGAVYLFAKIGIESSVTISISLMSFLFMVLVGLLGGIIYVVTLSPGRLQHYQADAAAIPKKA